MNGDSSSKRGKRVAFGWGGGWVDSHPNVEKNPIWIPIKVFTGAEKPWGDLQTHLSSMSRFCPHLSAFLLSKVKHYAMFCQSTSSESESQWPLGLLECNTVFLMRF